jgi:hypothetical protein
MEALERVVAETLMLHERAEALVQQLVDDCRRAEAEAYIERVRQETVAQDVLGQDLLARLTRIIAQ